MVLHRDGVHGVQSKLKRIPMASKIDWGMVSALAATASLIVGGVALYTAITGANATNSIAAEALKTARQANEIGVKGFRFCCLDDIAAEYL